MREGKRADDWVLLKRLTPYLKNYRMLMGFSLLFMIGFNVAGVLQPYLFKLGIDNHVAKGDNQGLLSLSIILFVVMISGFLLNYFFSFSVQYLGQRLLFDIRTSLFRHVTLLDNRYFDTHPVGRTLTHITNDVEALRQFISEGVVLVMGDLLKVGFILIAMVWINYRLALLVFITIPFFFLVTIFFRKTIRHGFRSVRKANAEINTTMVESVTGIKEVIQFNHQRKSIDSFEQANSRYLKAYLRVVHAYALYFPILEVVTNLGLVIILVFSHYFLGVHLQIGEIFAFFAYINLFFRPLRQMAERFNMFQSAMAAAERIFRLQDTPATITNLEDCVTIDHPLKGEIQFKKVTFAYQESAPVIRNLSFTIKPGETVALVGRTGSGKTTVINLVNRIYDIRYGSIMVDGTDIRHYNLFDLRTQMAVVPQDPFLFTGTVADNISLHHPHIGMDQVVEAAKQVNADPFIQQLPNKYQENVLEEGKRLSAGQRQLISYARAMVHKPAILILDEATANIDSETEEIIEIATRQIIANRTAIIIAHRLSTIQMVDRILVLHKGRLVEEGNHRQLLGKKGIYYRLYHTQAFAAL